MQKLHTKNCDIDLDRAFHDIALAYAMKTAKITEIPQDSLECIADEYLAAYGYLSTLNPEWLKESAERGQ